MFFATILFLGLFLFLQVGGHQRLLNDPGTYFHTRVGTLILERGELPRQDWFTLQFEGQPWIAQQWLGEVVMAVLYKWGGFDTQLLFALTGISLFLAWLGGRLVQRGLHPLLTILLVGMLLDATAHHFLLRPLLVSMLFQGLLVGLLLAVEGGTLPLAALWALPPLIVVWANAHGAVLGGLMTLGLFAGGWVLFLLVGRPGPVTDRRGVISLGLVTTVCFLAPLVNPYGLDLPRTWGTIMTSPLVEKLVIEHMPLLALPQGFAVLPLMAFFVFLVLTADRQRLGVGWLVPFAWMVLAFSRIRHAPLFAITAAMTFPDLIPSSRVLRWLEGKGLQSARLVPHPPQPGSLFSPWKPLLGLAGIILLAGLAVQGAGWRLPVFGRGWATPHPEIWPEEIRPVLEAFAARHPPKTPVFNEFGAGGYLTFFTPNLQIFLDDRCELAKDAGLREYVEAQKDPRIIASWTARYAFAGALTFPRSAFDRWFASSPAYLVTASCPVGVWYERRP
ncbi:MAG: hypothetical protein GX442_02655 [Candidatus Riflebacteria bacterium]|nr:hypothetical protein [Candidatus Riflebacteria bacterium]